MAPNKTLPPFDNATEPLHSGFEAYVQAPEDAVLSKLDWYRRGGEVSENQWRDVLGMLRQQAERLDVGYLRMWAGELGVADLLDRACREAGVQEP
jgi:hypothetical protein